MAFVDDEGRPVRATPSPFAPGVSTEPVFAPAMLQLAGQTLAAPSVASAPTPGQGLALDSSGKLSPALVGAVPVTTASSGDLTLTTGAQDVPGCSLALASPGSYLVLAVFDFDGTVTGWGFAVGELSIGGTAQTAAAILGDNGSANDRATVSQIWLPSISDSNTLIKLTARKTINAGTVKAHQSHSTLTAMRVG